MSRVPQESQVHRHGLERLRALSGDEATTVFLGQFADVAPEFADYVVEFAFGMVYDQPQLSLEEQEVAVIAALATVGDSADPLRHHIEIALRAGISAQRIISVLLQVCPYAGFPRTFSAIRTAREVFALHGLLPVPPAQGETVEHPAATPVD